MKNIFVIWVLLKIYVENRSKSGRPILCLDSALKTDVDIVLILGNQQHSEKKNSENFMLNLKIEKSSYYKPRVETVRTV